MKSKIGDQVNWIHTDEQGQRWLATGTVTGVQGDELVVDAERTAGGDYDAYVITQSQVIDPSDMSDTDPEEPVEVPSGDLDDLHELDTLVKPWAGEFPGDDDAEYFGDVEEV